MPRIKGQVNISTYARYLKETGVPSSRIITGRFYTFSYLFDKTKKSFNQLKMYDVFPLVFVYEQKGENFLGLNFHHIPPKSRQIWLSRARSLSDLIDKDNRVTDLINYNKLYTMYKKASSASVRQYKKNRVRNLRRVEAENLDEVMRFIANTYFGATVTQIITEYTKHVPYK